MSALSHVAWKYRRLTDCIKLSMIASFDVMSGRAQIRLLIFKLGTFMIQQLKAIAMLNDKKNFFFVCATIHAIGYK